jgi:hypothetical protein
MRGPNPVPMLKQLQMGLRAFLVLASKIWTFICFVFRKNTRAVILAFIDALDPCFMTFPIS